MRRMASASAWRNTWCPQGRALDKALELAERIAQNAPLTNYALTHVLPTHSRAAGRSRLRDRGDDGLDRAERPQKRRRAVRAFLEGKADKVKKA